MQLFFFFFLLSLFSQNIFPQSEIKHSYIFLTLVKYCKFLSLTHRATQCQEPTDFSTAFLIIFEECKWLHFARIWLQPARVCFFPAGPQAALHVSESRLSPSSNQFCAVFLTGLFCFEISIAMRCTCVSRLSLTEPVHADGAAVPQGLHKQGKASYQGCPLSRPDALPASELQTPLTTPSQSQR